jgi:hypothetical protein
VTEAALALVIVLALAGLGPREFVRRVRGRVPLVAFGLYWVAGAIATARGIDEYGFSQTLHDIGLLEYSALVVVVAVVMSSRRDVAWLMRCLALGGAVAIAFFLCASAFGAAVPPWQWATIGTAGTAIYISLFVCWFAGRVVHGERAKPWEWLLAWAGVALIALTYSRAAWMAAFVTLAALIALAPRGRRLAAAALGTLVLVSAGGAAIGAEKLQISGDAGTLRAASEALEAQTLRSHDGPEPSGGGDAKPSGNVEIPQAVRETFANNLSEGSNARWRLAIWKHDLKEGAKQPLLGVGYGTPTAFKWADRVYDGRTGNGLPEDVSGPHNSFINIFFRMGLLGALSLLALLVVAAVRVWPWLRSSDAPSGERATIVGLAAMLVFTTGIAAINVSLEGPFMGIFFWTILGLLLVVPKLYGTPPRAAPRPDPS